LKATVEMGTAEGEDGIGAAHGPEHTGLFGQNGFPGQISVTVHLQAMTAGKGIERAIDCVAGELGAEIARNLAPAGTMLVYGALSSHRQTDPAKFIMPLLAPRLIYSTATVRGWWLPRWVSSQPLAEVRATTSDLLTLLSTGVLTPPAIVRYSLKDFQEAIRLADGEAGQDKVLLDLSERAP
jgi:NADPH2:quinone reductase